MVRRAQVLAFAVLPLVLAACWPTPGGGPDRQNHNRFETAINTDSVSDLGPTWFAEIGDIESEPVLSDGKVFVHNGGTLFALDVETGSEVWSIDVDGTPDPSYDRFVGPVLIWDGSVAASIELDTEEGPHQISHQFDLATGAPMGRLISGHVSTARGPLLASVGPNLFQPDQDPWTDLYLRNTETGEEWTTVASSRPPNEVTIGHDLVFYPGHHLITGNGVHAHPVNRDPSCGPGQCLVWETELPGDTTFPVVHKGAGDTIYAVPEGGELYAMDAATGDILWTSDAGIGGVGSPALSDEDGLLYVPGSGGVTHAFDADGCGAVTCEPLWEASAGADHGDLGGQPTVAGTGADAVLLTRTAADGAVHAYPAAGCGSASCSPVWTGTVDGSALTTPVVVSRGQMYVGTDTGLAAFGQS